MTSGYASHRKFDDVFNHTVNTLLQERVHYNSIPSFHLPPSSAMLAVASETLVPLTKSPSSTGKRKRNETRTDFSPVSKTSDTRSYVSQNAASYSYVETPAAATTKSVDVQAGPSLILSINTTPSPKSQRKKRNVVSEKDTDEPSKTVKIAPFNHTSFSNSTPSLSDRNHPEIVAVAGGGISNVCHAVPIPNDKVRYCMDSVQSTPMVPVGKGAAFVSCAPLCCQGGFSSEPLSGQKINCSCSVHLRHHARYRPSLQDYGCSKKAPLVIDSDDDDITIIEDTLCSTKVQSPTVSSAAIQPPSPTTDYIQDDLVDSPGIQITDVMTLAPPTTNTQSLSPSNRDTQTHSPKRTATQTSVIPRTNTQTLSPSNRDAQTHSPKRTATQTLVIPRTNTQTLSPRNILVPTRTDTPSHTPRKMDTLRATPRQTEPHSTPTSPRHRARLSADVKPRIKPFITAVRTLDLTTSSTDCSSTSTTTTATTTTRSTCSTITSTCSTTTSSSSSNASNIIHIAATFSANDRRKAIERAEISSATSATSESSASSTSSQSEENENEGLLDPDTLLKMLQDIKRERPFKKLRVTARNLYQAVKGKNFSKVLALIVEGCQPNVQVETEKGRTALHAAAASGYLDIITCLKMAGGDLDVLDYDMRTPMFDAVENGRFKTVEYLVNCGASCNVKDQGGMTLLHVAARRGHNDIIRLLLDTGKVDINQKDDGGWTAIMWAAEDKMVETAKLLLGKRGNVHLRDLELNIPLHWAAYAGSYNMALLLLVNHSDLHSVNRHGETPLHVAARENNFSCVQLFINRGARIDLSNNEGKTPLDVAIPESKSRQLLETKQLLLLCQPEIKFRLLSCDISRGQENVAIPCINEVDDEPLPAFTFVKECCEVGGDSIEWNINTIQACICEGDCGSDPTCTCIKMCDEETLWYDKDGLINSDIQALDRPLIFECNKMCKCWSFCRNRVVQKGMQYPLQLFKTKKKGWAVRALCHIPKGVFLCEYTGELISDTDAEMRSSDTYLFDLDCKESDHMVYCIDGDKYGNISRFINHSCEPNCVPTRVFVDHQDIRFPKIAFFSSKDIELHEEICFNYGDRFWEVKKTEFCCECGTPSCNYKASC